MRIMDIKVERRPELKYISEDEIREYQSQPACPTVAVCQG